MLAALPLMGSPGPATLSLAAVGAAFGSARGGRYLMGIIAGTFGVLLLIATGVTGLILAVPAAVWLITAVGAAYILYLAYRIATAPVGAADLARTTPPTLSGGFVLGISNPKAYAAIGAVYSSHTVVADDLALDTGAKVAALLAMMIAVNTSWLLFGSAFALVLRNPRTGRIANVTFAVLLLLSVALALL